MAKFKSFIKRNFILVMLICLCIFFGVLTDTFFTIDNLITVLRQASILGMSACGMLFLMVTGNIDISLGGVMSFTSIMFGRMISSDYYNFNPLLAILIIFAINALMGYAKGWLITYTGMNALIATLGFSTLLKGVYYEICQAKMVTNLNPSLIWIGQGYVGRIPIPVIILAILMVITEFVLKKTYFGRFMYAAGSNGEAARLGGLNVDRIKRITYIIASCFATIAGIVLTLRVKSGQPTCGDPYQMNSMLACTVGGVSFGFGGGGGVINVIYGILVVGVITNGMTIMGISSYWQYIMQGTLIIVTIALDYMQRLKWNSKA